MNLSVRKFRKHVTCDSRMKGSSLISSMRTAGPASILLKGCGSDEARVTQMQELSHQGGSDGSGPVRVLTRPDCTHAGVVT